MVFCFFKQKTAYELRISDWSSDVCSSDLTLAGAIGLGLRLWLAGIGIWAIGHALGVWAARKQRDPPFAGDHEGGTFGDQDAPFRRRRRNAKTDKIGRAACRERVCQYV